MQDFLNGNFATFGINGTNYDGNEGWSIDCSPAELRTDNTAGGGASDRITGTKDLQGTMEMSWDSSRNPFDAPLTLAAGTVLTNLKLYLNGPTSPFYSLPKAIVLKDTTSAKVNEKVAITISFGNKGAFTRPTGNFSAIAGST
jgi:hypothetical protein